MTLARSLACVALVVVLAACATPVHQLAIANGNHLRVVNADSGQELHDVARYSEVMRLAYRPDGERLAVGVCFGNRIVELETNAYAEQAANNTDVLVGGHTQAGDCLGRKLARNLAPDAVNREITGVPGGPLNVDTHGNFPHHWPTICMTLRTVTDHQVPADQLAACAGLTPP